MTLRAKVIIAISVALVLLMIAVYATSRIILLDSFARLEDREVRERLQRGLAALTDEMAQLDSVAGSWAQWDDTYNYLEDASDTHIQLNLMEETFANLRLNLIVYVDLSGQIVYSQAVDLQSNTVMAIPPSLQSHLSIVPSPAVLLRHPDARSSVQGVLLLSDADVPLLIASRPIMRSGGKGPIRGTLIVGRYLDSAAIARIARLTQLELSVSRFDEAGLPLSDKSPFLVRPLSDETTMGYAMVTDIYARPSIVLEAKVRRDVYQQGQRSMTYINWSLAFVGLAFIVMTVLLWERLALTRLMRLSADVSKIGAGGDLAARVQMTGKDELSNVASSINRMLDELQHSEEALRESEERFRRQATDLRGLYEASLQLNAQLETVALLRIITEQAVELLHPRASGLYIYDPQRDELVLSFAVNYFDESRLVKPGQGLIGQTFRSRRSMYWPSEQDKAGVELCARLAVPLLGTDRVLGVLDMVGAESVFEKHNIQLAELFAAQAAVALEKAHLHDRVQRHARELAALNRASQAILSTLDLQAVLGLVIAECRSLLNAEGMSVLLYRQMTDELVFAAVDSPGSEQLTGRRIPATRGIAGWVLREKQAALIHDVHSDPRFYAQIDATTGLTTRSLLAAPLMTKGTIIGVIEAINKVDDVFDQHDLETLEVMASSAAIAAENARLYQMEKEQRGLAETLREVGATLVSTLDVATVLDRLLEQISRVVPHDTANIMLIEGDRVRMVRRRGYDRFGIDASDAPAAYPIASIPNLQQMIETGEPVVIPDTHADPNWVRRLGMGEWHRSYAGVPIRVRGRGIGFLNVHSATPGFFDYADAERLRAFADQAAIALENARLFGEERKTADRLQALSRRLVEVQEVERSRIARELHDEAGQSLTSLMVNLRLLEHEAHHPDKVVTLAGELRQMTDGVLGSLHRLAVGLRPASLDHLGLVAALRQYVETFRHQHNLPVQFEAVHLDDVRMPMEVETALYRIVQEALTNVARHAQATQVDVILERRGARLVLIIEDNGIGFDPNAAVPGDRLGMVSMKERAEMLGGVLEAESEIGKGTTIMVEVPYAHSYPDSG